MKIEENKVVELEYSLFDEKNILLEKEQSIFIFGDTGAVVEGLEKELRGRKAGEKFSISLDAVEAFGEFKNELIYELPLEDFGDIDDLKTGIDIELTDPDEEDYPFLATITKIDRKKSLVTVDANHPLSGQKVSFDVNILSVREATKEEIEHGHVHTN